MSLAVDPPARLDLSMRENDDKLVALMWRATDGTTSIPIQSARMTMQMDVIDEEPAVVHSISSVTPGDPSGWIEADRYDDGLVLIHVPFALWADITARTGVYDVIAVSQTTAVTRCLARGEFVIERGVSA